MKNCLITKLKASVDNNTLLPLGSIDFTVTSGGQFGIGVTKTTTFEILEGGTFSDDSSREKTVTTTSGQQAFVLMSVTANSKIRLYNDTNDAKYGIARIYSSGCALGFNIDDLQFISSSIKQIFNFNSPGGDISALKDKISLEDLNIAGPDVTGDLNDLSGITNIKTISIGTSTIGSSIYRATQIGGDIAIIARKTNLTSFNAYGCERLYGNIESFVGNSAVINLNFTNCTTQITGEITTLLEGLFAAGKTGNLSIGVRYTAITLNGGAPGVVTVYAVFDRTNSIITLYKESEHTTLMLTGTYSGGVWTWV